VKSNHSKTFYKIFHQLLITAIRVVVVRKSLG